MEEMELFDACTNYKREDGKVTISCKLGLWEVNGNYDLKIMDEALHYFRQYLSDGEYSSIVGGKTVMEKLTNHKE